MAKSDFKKEIFITIDKESSGEKFKVAWDHYQDCAVADDSVEVGVYQLVRIAKVEAKAELK